MRKKIGILGGTFDPFHKGHFMIAETAYEQFDLDEVWILPNGNPPHKQAIEQTGFDLRCEMIRLAIRTAGYMKLCRAESSAQFFHYTYQTLEYMNRQHPECDFYFIIGADSLKDFPTWRQPEKISRLCTLLVAGRDEAGIAQLRERAAQIERRFGGSCRVMNAPKIDAASKEIRAIIQNGEDASPYLEDEVYRYILEKNLYKDTVQRFTNGGI